MCSSYSTAESDAGDPRATVKSKLERLRVFILNFCNLDITSTHLRITRRFPRPNATSLRICIDSKQAKQMPLAGREIARTLDVMEGVCSFELKNTGYDEELDLPVGEKERIYKSLIAHSVSLTEVKLESLSAKDLLYLSVGFFHGGFEALRSLEVRDLDPEGVSEADGAKLASGFSAANSVEFLSVGFERKAGEEIQTLLGVFAAMPAVKIVEFRFAQFTEKICSACTKFFERPTVSQIVTTFGQYTEFCMTPFGDLVYLKSSLKRVEFACQNQDVDTEHNLVDMSAFFRLLTCSAIESFTLKNICIKELSKHAEEFCSKNSVLRELTLERAATLWELGMFLTKCTDLRKLERLRLDFAISDGKMAASLAQLISAAPGLVHVDLTGCRIPDSAFCSIRPARLLGKCRYVALRGNYLCYNSYSQIVELLRQSCTIEYLDITDTEVPADKVGSVFTAMQNHPSLRTFLWNCVYGSTMYDGLNLALKYGKRIERLEMRDLNFSPLQIFRSLKRNSPLRRLSIGVAAFDSLSVRKLWKLLCKNGTLDTLFLNLISTNFAQGVAFDSLFRELTRRLEIRQVCVRLKRYSQTDPEYNIKLGLGSRLVLNANLNILWFEHIVADWWNLGRLHSVLVRDLFLRRKADWIRWLIGHKLGTETKARLVFYLY